MVRIRNQSYKHHARVVLPPSTLGLHGLGLHCVRTLNARRGILRVCGTNSTTFHGLASFKTAHVITLNTVRTMVMVLLLIISTTLAGIVYPI